MFVGGLCAIHHIRMSLISGTALPTLLKQANYYIDFLAKYHNTLCATYIMMYRDTISFLMGNEDSDCSQVQENAEKVST